MNNDVIFSFKNKFAIFKDSFYINNKKLLNILRGWKLYLFVNVNKNDNIADIGNFVLSKGDFPVIKSCHKIDIKNILDYKIGSSKPRFPAMKDIFDILCNVYGKVFLSNNRIVMKKTEDYIKFTFDDDKVNDYLYSFYFPSQSKGRELDILMSNLVFKVVNDYLNNGKDVTFEFGRFSGNLIDMPLSIETSINFDKNNPTKSRQRIILGGNLKNGMIIDKYVFDVILKGKNPYTNDDLRKEMIFFNKLLKFITKYVKISKKGVLLSNLY